MKQNAGISIQLTVGLIVFSMLLAACGSRESANTNAGYQTLETRDVARSSNTMSSNSSAMNAPTEAKKADGNFDAESSNERYARIEENPFLETARAPLSTFSIDVDTASYANVRRYLNDGQMPPKDAVRIEELIIAIFIMVRLDSRNV